MRPGLSAGCWATSRKTSGSPKTSPPGRKTTRPAWPRRSAALSDPKRDAWGRFQQAPDPLSRKLEAEIWLKVSGELLRYERGVSKDKREAGELLELKDVQNSIWVLSRAFMAALRTMAVEHVEHHGDGLESIASFLQNAACLSLPALGDFAPEGDLSLTEVNGSIRECFVEAFGTWEFQGMPEASRNRIALFEALLELSLAKTAEAQAEAEEKIGNLAA